jgi:hypothetical protein
MSLSSLDMQAAIARHDENNKQLHTAEQRRRATEKENMLTQNISSHRNEVNEPHEASEIIATHEDSQHHEPIEGLPAKNKPYAKNKGSAYFKDPNLGNNIDTSS